MRFLKMQCHVCLKYKLWGCECGWIAAIAGAVVSAGLAAYGANQAQSAQEEQYKYAQKAEDIKAQAEQDQATARTNQIQYEAAKREKSFLSRAAGAGVQVGSGSLLETEGEFGADVEYSKQLARYPHELAGYTDKYQSDLFGYNSAMAGSRKITSSLMAGGQSLATSAGSLYLKRKDGGAGTNGIGGPGTIDPRDAGEGLPY
jgi:hypothetical protein